MLIWMRVIRLPEILPALTEWLNLKFGHMAAWHIDIGKYHSTDKIECNGRYLWLADDKLVIWCGPRATDVTYSTVKLELSDPEFCDQLLLAVSDNPDA